MPREADPRGVRRLAGPGLPEGGKAWRLYLQLRDAISRGTFPAGSRLPGEDRLADMFGVSRATVRRALDGLTTDHLIEKRVGAGSIVLGDRQVGETLSADLTTLIPQLVEMGQATEARLLSFSYGPAPAAVSAAMKLPTQARVQEAVRIRLTGGRPFSHLTTYVPEAIAASYTESDLATQPLYRLLERSGVQVDTAHQTVTATLAGPEVAEALGVSVGSPLLSLARTVFDRAGRGVEHLLALYRPDVFSLEMTLSRVSDGGGRDWRPVIAAGEPAGAAKT